MSEFALWITGVIALAAVLTWGLSREMARSDQERRLREWLATSPAAFRLKGNLEAMSRQIGMALLPAMQRLATAVSDAQPTLREFAAALTAKPTTPAPEPAAPVAQASGEQAGE